MGDIVQNPEDCDGADSCWAMLWCRLGYIVLDLCTSLLITSSMMNGLKV